MGFWFKNILLFNRFGILIMCKKMAQHTIYETTIKRTRSNESFLRKVNSPKLKEDGKNHTIGYVMLLKMSRGRLMERPRMIQ